MESHRIIIPENILEIFDMGSNAGRSNAIRMAQGTGRFPARWEDGAFNNKK